MVVVVVHSFVKHCCACLGIPVVVNVSAKMFVWELEFMWGLILRMRMRARRESGTHPVVTTIKESSQKHVRVTYFVG